MLNFTETVNFLPAKTGRFRVKVPLTLATGALGPGTTPPPPPPPAASGTILTMVWPIVFPTGGDLGAEAGRVDRAVPAGGDAARVVAARHRDLAVVAARGEAADRVRPDSANQRAPSGPTVIARTLPPGTPTPPPRKLPLRREVLDAAGGADPQVAVRAGGDAQRVVTRRDLVRRAGAPVLAALTPRLGRDVDVRVAGRAAGDALGAGALGRGRRPPCAVENGPLTVPGWSPGRGRRRPGSRTRGCRRVPAVMPWRFEAGTWNCGRAPAGRDPGDVAGRRGQRGAALGGPDVAVGAERDLGGPPGRRRSRSGRRRAAGRASGSTSWRLRRRRTCCRRVRRRSRAADPEGLPCRCWSRWRRSPSRRRWRRRRAPLRWRPGGAGNESFPSRFEPPFGGLGRRPCRSLDCGKAGSAPPEARPAGDQFGRRGGSVRGLSNG